MKEKGIRFFIVISLLALLLMPFSVYANTVGGNSPIIGVNINEIDYEFDSEVSSFYVNLSTNQTRWQCVSSHSTMGCQVWQSQNTYDVIQDDITGTISGNLSTTYGHLYEYEFILDKPYVGSVTFSEGLPGTYYVNGTSFTCTSQTLVGTWTVSSYSLQYAPLETMTRLRDYDIYNSSMYFVFDSLNRLSSKIRDLGDFVFNYPVFNLASGDRLTTVNLGTSSDQKVWLFFASNSWYGNIQSLIDTTGYNVEYYDYLTSFKPWFIYRVCLSNNYSVSQTSDRQINLVGNLSFYVPLYMGIYRSNDINQEFQMETELALLLKVNNKELSLLNIIANGNSQSSSAASGLESSNSTMASDMNSMATIENGYSQDFNSQLQNIDFTNPIQQNQGILPAANFVISIFNGLISNNPFTVLIIIVCILLIGKKVIGK